MQKEIAVTAVFCLPVFGFLAALAFVCVQQDQAHTPTAKIPNLQEDEDYFRPNLTYCYENAEKKGEFYVDDYGQNGTYGCSLHPDYCKRRGRVPCCAHLYAELLFDVIDVLEANNCSYSIKSGTLLGAVRDGMLLPYDTVDVDLMLKDGEILECKNLVVEFFQSNGMEVDAYYQDTNWTYAQKWHARYGQINRKFCFAATNTARLYFFGHPENREKSTLLNIPPRLDLDTLTKLQTEENTVPVKLGTIGGSNGPEKIVQMSRYFRKHLEKTYDDHCWREPPKDKYTNTNIRAERLAFYGYVWDPSIFAEIGKTYPIINI